MDNEARKAEIRRCVTLLRYPRRAKAAFTDENDHNPMVLQDCPTCFGSGKVCQHWSEDDGSRDVLDLIVCAACNGSGVTCEVEPYFSKELPEASARADAAGWLTCPGCGWRFTLRDPHAWSGRRHMRCGQKIKPLMTEADHES